MQLAAFTAGLACGVIAIGATIATSGAVVGPMSLAWTGLGAIVISMAISGTLLALATVLMSMAFAHPRVRGRFMVPAAILLFAPAWMGCFAWIASVAGGFAIATTILAPLLYASVMGLALGSMSRTILDSIGVAATVVGVAFAASITLFALGSGPSGPGPIAQQQFAIAVTQLAILVVLIRHAWRVLHEPAVTLAMPQERRECRVCGYDMVNAASRTCPECGVLMPRWVRDQDDTP